MKVYEALNNLEKLLAGKIAADAAFEARIILSSLWGCAMSEVGLRFQELLADELWLRALQIAEKRAEGQPLQYLLGEQYFFGLRFKVDERVLIPRYDTEPMVEYLASAFGGVKNIKIADICTGSGAIAVALAVNIAGASLTATDISAEALEMAAENAASNNVSDRIEFLQGDLTEPLLDAGRQFDLVVANPPYIAAGEIASLAADVRCEPRIALDGGADGLCFYRRLAAEVPLILRKGGMLALEYDPAQAEAVAAMLTENDFRIERTGKDLAGRERSVFARLV